MNFDDLKPRPKGFAAMTPEQRKEISSRGGKRAHELGKAFEWSKESAKEAGRAGGKASAVARARKVANEPTAAE